MASCQNIFLANTCHCKLKNRAAITRYVSTCIRGTGSSNSHPSIKSQRTLGSNNKIFDKQLSQLQYNLLSQVLRFTCSCYVGKYG